jgi:hypothetical protein
VNCKRLKKKKENPFNFHEVWSEEVHCKKLPKK